VISVTSREPFRAQQVLQERFGWDPQVMNDEVRVVITEPSSCVSKVVDALGSSALSITVGRPGLEDVFIRKTGSVFRGE